MIISYQVVCVFLALTQDKLIEHTFHLIGLYAAVIIPKPQTFSVLMLTVLFAIDMFVHHVYVLVNYCGLLL